MIGVTVAGATYFWNTGATTDSIAVSSTGTFWVDATLNGCAVRDSIGVSVTPLPVVDLGTDIAVCPGAQATLDATLLGGSYLWSNGAVTPTITVGTGTWSVDVMVNGCTASDVATITNLTPPAVDLGPDTTLCPNSSIVLNAGPSGTNYLWSTGATGQSIMVTSTTTASVTVTDAQGCSSTDAITISYADPGALSLGPDTSVCAGEPVTLDATMPGASGYLWSDGTTNAVLTTTIGGTWSVAVTQGACLTGDTIIVQSVQSPSITLGNDTTLCSGETLDLQVSSANATFEWQDGSSGNYFAVNAAGDYWVVATNAATCTDTASIHVAYLNASSFNLGADTAICEGTSLLLDAGLPGGNTQWTGAVNSSTPMVTASTSGTFIATTTVSGCAFTDSISVTVFHLPAIDLGPDQDLCSGSTLQLTVNANSLLWDDGSSAGARTIDQPGTYWAMATNNGCSASDTVNVTGIPLPVVQLGPDTGLCASALLYLDATVLGGSYLWNDGSTLPARSVSAGTWSVEVSALGCSATDSIRIDPLPSPTLSLPADTTLCSGETWSINVTQPGSSYLWSTGSNSPSLLVNAPGTYGVTVDRDGCVAAANVDVAFVDLSNFSLGPDTVLCPGETLVLAVTVPGAMVAWQDGSTATQRTVSTAGTYEANIAVGGCTAQDDVHIGFTPLLEPDLGENRTLCAGDTALLLVSSGPAQVVWNNGTTGDALAVTSTGTYSVTLSLDGCVTSDAALITFLPVITQLDLGPDGRICPDNTLTLDATIPGASYIWNDGSHQSALVVDRPGVYHVTAQGPCILASDTVLITEGNCAPEVHIPNAFTPDGDDINDSFTPIVSDAVRSWSFSIFNRWGELIFTTDVPGVAWDGKVNGVEAPVGVYVWDVHYGTVTDAGVVQERLRGSVTLVR